MPSTHQHPRRELGDTSKQRASKACNRCRAKKARCSGGYPCTKCKASDGVCIFGYPKKSKRKTFPEHYVRALEMQQFKLVAGLQTMYTMLLAANSWPGPQLAEHKGNPLVHEILERLGLLEHEKDIDFELEAGEYDHDHQPSSDEALTVDSPHVSQRGTEQSPEPQSPEPSACPSRLAHRECPFTEADDTINFNAWHTRPMHSHFDQFAFLPSQLPPEFSLEPPPRMVQSLSSTSQSTHSVDATDWTAVDCTSAWWQDVSRTVQARSCSSVGSISALFATHMAVGNDSNPASYARNSFLVDPGVYASDFDVER